MGQEQNNVNEADSREPAFETQAIHSGLSYRSETGSVIPPVYLTSTFAYGNPGGFDYTRSGNPNFRNLQSTMAVLENAEYATVFANGVSAITAVVSTLKSGDLVIAEENIYGCTFRLFDKVFAKFGVQIEYFDFSSERTFKDLDGRSAVLFWIESPTNPNLKILDIVRIADLAHRCGASLLVDNTFASSYLQNPLTLGADLSLLSTTKYTNGHSDALGGVVCSNDIQWQERMIFAQKALGLQPAPFDSWLISRGVKTEAIRMERHCSNALGIAEFLQDELGYTQVRYPFLPSHPQYELAKRQMRGGSGIVTVDFNLDADSTLANLQKLRFFTLAESLGGIESLVCHPATMTHASIPRERRLAVGITDSLVRFSIGIENLEDLKNDIRCAFGL